MRITILLLVLLVATSPVRAQDVIRFEERGSASERYERAAEALEDAATRGWLGFSVTRMMRQSSVMGRFVGDWDDSPTIEELLDPSRAETDQSVEQVARNALDDIKRRESGASQKLVPKRIAVMLRTDVHGELDDVAYANMTMSFDTGDLPLYWIGHLDDGPAFDLLRGLYLQHRSGGTDIAEDLISSIGLLNTSDVHAWLLDIVASDRPADEREQAVFWLGESRDASVTHRLHALADADRSEDVREAAVFALYRMKSEEAVDYLVRLARRADHGETREKARFWLAQKAGDRLTEGSDAAEPSDMEKRAVFALSQLDDDDAITELSSLARSHRNPHVRKQALFWLGQRGDEESLATIVDVLHGRR